MDVIEILKFYENETKAFDKSKLDYHIKFKQMDKKNSLLNWDQLQ